MPDKMIEEIHYNHLNLPNKFIINNQSTSNSYLYRADGTKLHKAYISSSNGVMYATSTEYLDGFHYATSNGNELGAMYAEAGGTAYEPEAFMQIIQDMGYQNQLKFVPTAEGFYDFENNEYIYQYKDHLGNVRMSYKKEGNDLLVTDSNDYYPFGMSFIRNAEEVAYFGTGSYKNYKYQGQELQETGFYSFKWRNYMPDVGRFFNIDPLAEKYPTWAPYVFSGNRVVDARELEGLEPHVLFNTRENAAANFGKQYNGKSIKQNQEYISIIYSRKVEGKLYYAYKNPVGGTQAKANVTVDSPEGTSVVAAVHTHGKYLEAFANNEFSKTDINGYERVNFDGFVITPDGSLKYYDVSSNSKKILRTDMPSDPNDPDRKNNIPPNENPSPSSGDYKPDLFPSLQKTSPSDKKQVVLDDGLKSINDKKKEFVEPKIN
ncbi:RHS repeat-associated core domain-containing protein, partial [Chryseobacterium formosense]